MIVVADTSPFNYLIQLACEALLPQLYDRVIIPQTVLLELKHMDAPRIVRAWANNLPPWIELKQHPLPTIPISVCSTAASAKRFFSPKS